MRLPVLDAGIVVAYLLGMVAVGVVVARRIRGFDDFFVAGGRMTTPLLVCTLVSSYYGLDVTFGSSETAFEEGIAAFFAYSAPFYAAYVATAVLVAPRLRRVRAISLPEAMDHFYGRGARLASAVASFVYSAPILAVAGMGYIGGTFFGVEPWVGAVVGASVSLVYTLLGGLLADALTDTIQFTLMCVTAAVAVTVAMGAVGTPESLSETLPDTMFQPLGELSLAEVVIYGLVALTPLVEPVFYQRTFAARGSREIVRALLIGVVLWMAYDWAMVYLGITAQELVRVGEIPADVEPAAVLLHAMEVLLPTGLLGLFLAGCMATAMSTVDSYTLVAAGNLSYDLWEPLSGRRLDDRARLRWARLATIPTLGIALLVATEFESIRDAWIFMSSVLLSASLVPMLAALFVLRVPRHRAGTWSTVAGTVASLALFFLFLAAGVETDAGEVVVALPGGGELLREASLLVSLPIALAAFAAGYLRDRLAGGEVRA